MNDSAIFGMLGLLIGGAGVWAVMRARVAIAERPLSLPDGRGGYRAATPTEVLGRLTDLGEQVESWSRAAADAFLAHSRLSDAHNTQSARIERALDQVTEGANATVVRMARILKGDA